MGEGFSGHSGRVGVARRMARAGAPDSAIMRQGRWSSSAMVARYTRGESAGDAAPVVRFTAALDTAIAIRLLPVHLLDCPAADLKAPGQFPLAHSLRPIHPDVLSLLLGQAGP